MCVVYCKWLVLEVIQVGRTAEYTYYMYNVSCCASGMFGGGDLEGFHLDCDFFFIRQAFVSAFDERSISFSFEMYF